MVNKLISIRLPRELLKESRAITKEERFTSLQEFIREAVRKSVKEYRLQQSIKEFERFYGIAKNNPNVRIATKEELEELVRKRYFKGK